MQLELTLLLEVSSYVSDDTRIFVHDTGLVYV